MGRPNPVEQYPLLYINKMSGSLWQVRKIDANQFVIKGPRYVTRSYIQKYFEYYGLIDRFGKVLRYQKIGTKWKKVGIVGEYNPVVKKWQSVKESEEAVIKELNKINRRNPDLAYYGQTMLKPTLEPQEGFESV